MQTRYIAVAGLLAVALFGCGQKRPDEPSEQSLRQGVAECAKGACKEFKKVSCTRKQVDPAVPSQDVFQCTYSYVLAAGATAGTRTGTKCFNPDGTEAPIGFC